MTDYNRYVLACIDGSSLGEAICDYSSWIAKTVAAPLKFLHTIEHVNTPAVADLTGTIGLGASEDLLNELTSVEQSRSKLLIEQGNRMLKAAKQRVIDDGINDVEIHQRHGSLAESLVDLESEIRVLVVGIRGELHDNDPKAIGTQLETTVRSLHKPILVVNRSFAEPQSAMLAFDGSEAAEKALNMVASSPLFSQMPIDIVYVGNRNDKIELLVNAAAEKLNSAGRRVKTVFLDGDTEEALSSYQVEQDIDLTIMGAFSHNRVRDFLLGSFTAKMLEKTQRPLLLLR